jgi:hypothetical protein
MGKIIIFVLAFFLLGGPFFIYSYANKRDKYAVGTFAALWIYTLLMKYIKIKW